MRVLFFSILLLALPSAQNERNEATVTSGSNDIVNQETEALRTLDNTAFKLGEYLKYRIHYGIIDAGVAELTVQSKTTRVGRPVYHMVGKGRTVGMAEWFFKTRDTYETYIDEKAMLPWEFKRDVNEGGYIIKRHVMFDHYNNHARDLEEKPIKTYQIPNNSQDLFSTFYYARCLPTEGLNVGETIPVEMFLDHEKFGFKFKYLGTETIKSEFGKVRCKKFIPVVQSGRVFSDQEGITLWVTDDKNKIPIRLEAELAVGSIKMDLEEYKNNLHPIDFKK